MNINNPYFVSAYSLAVRQGFDGTLDEYLESLHGYIHIRWSARNPQSDDDMQETPADWMGVLCDNLQAASKHYTDYQWMYVKGAANGAVLAPAYDETAVYAKDDLVSYGDAVFQAKTSVGPEEWTAAHWKQTTIAERMAEILEGVAYKATSVQVTAQTLSDTQKAQARENIGLQDALKRGTALVLDPSWYGDTLPASGVQGQVFFLKV